MCKHHIGKSKICVNITLFIVGKLEYVMSTSLILIAIDAINYLLIHTGKGEVANNIFPEIIETDII